MIKSFSELALNITEQEYRDLSYLSYSALAKYEKGGFSSISHLYDKQESDALTFGSMVDTIITEGMDKFKDKFIVAEFKVPSEALVTITKDLLDKTTEEHLDNISSDIILDTCNTFEYCMRMSDEVRVRKVKEGCSEYFNSLRACAGKIVVSEKIYQEVLATVGALKNSPQSAQYLQHTKEGSDVEFLYQQKFRDVIEGLEVKCMTDLLIVNHTKKIIIPIDLKTSSLPEYEFPKKYLENRYDIQSRLYCRILKALMNKDEYFKDFSLACFRFLVVNKDNRIPLLYTDSKSHEQGKDIELHFPSGYIKILRDPITIGKELQEYINTNAKVPKTIDVTKPVDIYKQLLNE